MITKAHIESMRRAMHKLTNHVAHAGDDPAEVTLAHTEIDEMCDLAIKGLEASSSTSDDIAK